MKLFILPIAMMLCVACSPATTVKAPCDYHGSFCGKKIKINWEV